MDCIIRHKGQTQRSNPMLKVSLELILADHKTKNNLMIPVTVAIHINGQHKTVV